MTTLEYVEVVAVETARYEVTQWVTITRTNDSGDWARCVRGWDAALERRGVYQEEVV